MKRNHHWRWDAAYQEATCTVCGMHTLVVRDPNGGGRVALDLLSASNTQRIARHVGELPGCRGKRRG